MSNKPIVTVNVSLQTATVSRKGFGTPLFISTHHNFQERVRTYSSLKSVGDDFSAADPAHIAATAAFSNTPSVSEFKVGRREADAVITPTDVADGSVHTLTVTVNDGDTVVVSITTGAGDDEAAVATAMKAAIDGNAAVAAHVTTSVVGATTAGTLVVSPTLATDTFAITDITNGGMTYSASAEVAGDVLTAILAVDEDFYFVTAEDHTNAFVLALAAAAEARTMLYFVSTQEQASITTAYSVAAVDLIALLVQGNFERTVAFWSQVADTTYPECAFVGVNAPFAPDEQAVVWDGRNIPVVIGQNVAGNALTSTQTKNLFDRNCNYMASTAVGIRQLGGKSCSGEWIDNIHTRDTIVARVQEGQEALVLNQAGSKLEGGKAGVALADAALIASLNPFVPAKSLVGFSTDTSAATIDQNTRTLSNLRFNAELTGSIIRIVINGTLTNQTL